MAVTVEELAIALRLEAVTDAQTAILTRLLGVGEAHVALLIPAAPEPIQDECVVRLATYLFDAPVGRRDAYANAWVNSGAGALASRFKPQAASGSTGGDLTPGVTPDGGGTGLSESEVAALIEVHRELSEAHHVPGTGGGGLTESQVATLIQAHRDIEAAHHVPGTGGGGFPTTRTQVLSDTASSTNKAIQATEPFLPNQLYEVIVGAWARHIFLTIESGGYAVSYLVPDQALDLEAAPVDSPYFVCVLTIGSTVVSSFSLREQTGLITIPVTINKLT